MRKTEFSFMFIITGIETLFVLELLGYPKDAGIST
jgi:hypothetical protein